jgi:hypothetical protein
MKILSLFWENFRAPIIFVGSFCAICTSIGLTFMMNSVIPFAVTLSLMICVLIIYGTWNAMDMDIRINLFMQSLKKLNESKK